MLLLGGGLLGLRFLQSPEVAWGTGSGEPREEERKRTHRLGGPRFLGW